MLLCLQQPMILGKCVLDSLQKINMITKFTEEFLKFYREMVFKDCKVQEIVSCLLRFQGGRTRLSRVVPQGVHNSGKSCTRFQDSWEYFKIFRAFINIRIF